ncbi:choline transporter-like 1 isoform X2 [Bemisia tabaci]|uniref:choline transporter-like 1 isoform X2 n=1 Tax=Bemisia tabaci TaxID=7038 RepID=UPI0008F99BEC|nr:PREDICTED: CTL-like protein 1 isoform X2 [Bemisia tabaci]
MGCCIADSDTDSVDHIKVRGCTDPLWLIIFITFWLFMIFIAGFAFVLGDPLRLIHGYDSFGNTCGQRNNNKMGSLEFSGLDMSDKKYLFFMDMSHINITQQICVKKCPDRDIVDLEDVQRFFNETGSSLCSYNVDLVNMNFSRYFDVLANKSNPNLTIESLSTPLGPCPPFPIYKSTSILNRCVPVVIKKFTVGLLNNFIKVLNRWDLVEEILGDVYNAWPTILGFTVFALVLSIITVSLLHLFTSIATWLILMAVSVGSVGATMYLWYTYFEIKWKLDHESEVQPERMFLNRSLHNEQAICLYAIVATIITAILLLLVLVMCKRVSTLAILFKDAASCLSELPFLFLQPLISFVILMVFYTFWIAVIVSLATANYPGTKQLKPFTSLGALASTSPSAPFNSTFNMGTPKPLSVSDLKKFTFVEYVDPTWVRYMWWVYVIGLIWTSEFVLACQQMIIAGAVAKWYFEVRNKEENNNSILMSSVRTLLKYHLGSMALGSLLITIFKIPRLIITYFHNRFKNQEEESVVAKCGLKSCYCCFLCLENFIRYMNHNAYTIIAIRGIPFCPAASRAWNVLVSNALQLAVINSVGDFILFLGKCFVTAVTGAVGLLVLKQDETLHFYAAPMLVISIFAFFIAHAVISLYEIVIDTLFLCMCEDKNMNGEEGAWKNTGVAALVAKDQVPSELAPINT